MVSAQTDVIFLRISKMPQMGNSVRILLGHICVRADTGRLQHLHTDYMATQAEMLFNAPEILFNVTTG